MASYTQVYVYLLYIDIDIFKVKRLSGHLYVQEFSSFSQCAVYPQYSLQALNGNLYYYLTLIAMWQFLLYIALCAK